MNKGDVGGIAYDYKNLYPTPESNPNYGTVVS